MDMKINKLIITAFVGKSGAGKDYVVNSLCNHYSNKLHKIISYTSRLPRNGEIDGKDYHFISKNLFEDMIKKGKMLEYTKFNGWYYGTAIDDLDPNKLNIGVFNPEGVYNLLNNNTIITSICEVECKDDIKRLNRITSRDKKQNRKEILRRWKADDEDFKKFHRLLKENNISYGLIDNTKERE